MDAYRAAELLHYTVRHVRKLARQGKLPVRRIKVKRTVTTMKYVFPENLVDWVNSGGYVPYSSRKKRQR